MKKIDRLADAWLKAKDDEAQARNRRIALEEEMLAFAGVDPGQVGTTTLSGDVHKIVVRVDAERKASLEEVIKAGLAPEVARRMFVVKTEFSKSNYNALLKEVESEVMLNPTPTSNALYKKLEQVYEKCVEEKIRKPAFTVE